MALSYEDMRTKLVERLKSFYPDRYQSFHEASTGMMLTELLAFVGSAIEDYSDNVESEIYDDTVTDVNHAIAIAKSRGYKPRLATSSYGYQQFMIRVTNLSDAMLILQKGTIVEADDGSSLELLEAVDFSVGRDSKAALLAGDERDVTYSGGSYTVRKTGLTVIGTRKQQTYALTTFKAYLELPLPAADNVVEILSVADSSGNLYREVDCLSQEFVLTESTNSDSDSNEVHSVLTLAPAPYRFVFDYDIFVKAYKLVFGNGKSLAASTSVVPSLDNIIRNSAVGLVLDKPIMTPELYIDSSTLGLAPYNTTLTVNYRTVNATTGVLRPNTITSINTALYSFKDSSMPDSTKEAVLGSLTTWNAQAVTNGSDPIALPDILERSRVVNRAQGRAVTLDDYVALAYTLPSQYGRVYKASAYYDARATTTYVAVLSLQEDQPVAPTATLKKNLKTYIDLNKVASEYIAVIDGVVIDVSIVYQITSLKDNVAEILQSCNEVLAAYYNSDYFTLGRPIVLSTITQLLQSVPGVQSVVDVSIQSKSTSYPSLAGWTNQNIISCPATAVFNIRNPYSDIKGSVV